MCAHGRVSVEAGLGIPGDRYRTRRGHWSDPRWRDQQITFIAREFLDRLSLSETALRRNVIIEGVELELLVGLEFAIGTARFQGRRLCAPCMYIERLNARPGLFTSLAGHGGIRAAVLESGEFAVGDELRILGVMDHDLEE
jgi:MOSC domain-containing protein YiiM